MGGGGFYGEVWVGGGEVWDLGWGGLRGGGEGGVGRERREGGGIGGGEEGREVVMGLMCVVSLLVMELMCVVAGDAYGL